jgi:predicted nucleic acid-binding protein
MPGSFVDTNVLIYVASNDPVRSQRAEKIISDGGTISVQVLNEIANVARRKMRLSWNETHALLALIRGLLEVRPLTVEIHEKGLALAERYRFSIYDAMIVASALNAECNILWSEDMQAGIKIENKLRVLNPFAR